MVDIGRNEYTRQWRARRKELSGPSETSSTLLVAAIGSRPAWQSQAACLGCHPSLFFPERGDDNGNAAKRVCKFCPVQSECLADGMHEKHGVWGGTSERERRILRRQRKKAS